MDQYPYSIPPGFHPYAGNAPEKNTDMPTGTVVPNQNPYYMHSGASEVPPFGYAHPAEQDHIQQQQIVQPNEAPIAAVHANGLMPSIPPIAGVGYGTYSSNPAPYVGEYPAVAVPAPVPPMAAPLSVMEGIAYGPQSFEPHAVSNQSAVLFPPVQPVVPPASIEPLDAVDSAMGMEVTVPPETLKVALDSGEPPIAEAVEPETPKAHAETVGGDSEPATEEDKAVESKIEESIAETAQSVETPVADPTTLPENVESSKISEEHHEPVQISTETSVPPSTSDSTDQPTTATEEPNALPDKTPETTEESDKPKSRSPTPGPNLGVSTEDISTTSCKKKRRRIVTLNDEEDSDEEDISNRLELLRSPEPPAVEGSNTPVSSAVVGDPTGSEDKQQPEKDGDGSDGSDRDDEEDRRNSSASGSVSILQNVVMIPAGGDTEAHKRKKIRVLDSDDEEDQALVSLDDIGLTGEGADDLNPGGLLVDENAENDDLGTVDGIELDQMEQIVAMDAPIIDPSEMANEEDDDDGRSNAGENEKETSDQEQDGSVHDGEAADEEAEDEELGEEEEIVEEGVEMITAVEDGEAIGIATDDEQELDETAASADEAADAGEASEAGDENDDQRSGADEEAGEENDEQRSDADEEQATDEEQSEAAAEQSENERRESDSDNERNDENEEEEVQNDQSESRASSSSPVEQDKESQDSTSAQRNKQKNDGKKSDSEDDDVVCQNDLELNTISLLTDEEDEITMPLPPPKKELPVVRIVNIKKELLDNRPMRKESNVRMDAATSYQQQHYLKRQQQMAQKKRDKEKKRSERTFDNNDPFGPWSSSSSEDEFIPNDIYFGTPDRVFTASTKIRCQRQKMMNDRYAKHSKPGRPAKRKYGEELDAEQRRKQKQKLEEISRLNLPTYQQQQLQSLLKKKKRSRSDRFYDKSQDIPNDIYFGNVNVPLHILHGFGDSSSDEDRRGGNIWRTSQPSSSSTSSRGGKHQSSTRKYKKTSSSTSYSRSPHSPSNDRSVQAMKEYLKIAGFKNVKFHKLWEGCKSNQERANAILRLMQEKGLEGEPTVAKCRELRKQLQMEREAQVLDTSLIIDSGEGRITRRSARNPQNQATASLPADPNAPSTSGVSQPPAVPPESLETLNRIRNVIDPDSEGEE